MYYDLHIHTCLSPCADDDMTPNNIVNMALLNGLDVIAVTDHNTTGNCRAVMEAGKPAGLMVIPGMELETSEEIHVVCLFPDIISAETFGSYVAENMPKIENRADIYGKQLLMNEKDEIIGTEQNLLVIASFIGIYDVPQKVAEHGGVCILAHIDRHSNGVLSVLTDIDPDMGFTLAEVAKKETIESYKKRFNFLKFVNDSDSHNLWTISDANECNKISKMAKFPVDFIKYLQENQ